MTLWSMSKSPLMFGGDLRHLDGSTFNLITNPTLLEINHYSSSNMEVLITNSFLCSLYYCLNLEKGYLLYLKLIN